MSIVTLIRVGLAGALAGWIIYFGYLIVAAAADREIAYSPLRAATVQVLAIVTVAAVVAGIISRAVRRLEARWGSLGEAMELGRDLERIRDQQRRGAVVVSFRDRFSDRLGH